MFQIKVDSIAWTAAGAVADATAERTGETLAEIGRALAGQPAEQVEPDTGRRPGSWRGRRATRAIRQVPASSAISAAKKANGTQTALPVTLGPACIASTSIFMPYCVATPQLAPAIHRADGGAVRPGVAAEISEQKTNKAGSARG